MELKGIPNTILYASLYCISRGYAWPLLGMEKYGVSLSPQLFKDKEIELYKKVVKRNLETEIQEKIDDLKEHLEQTKQKCEENYKNSEFKDKGEFIPYIKEEYFVKNQIAKCEDMLIIKKNFEKFTAHLMERYTKDGFPFVYSIYVPARNTYDQVLIEKGNVYLIPTDRKNNYEEIFNSKKEGLKFSKIRKLYENDKNSLNNSENNDEKE